MKLTKYHIKKAQALPLFAIALLVMIAMAMLVLDGGMSYLNRRSAQAAADAAALAGAQAQCADLPQATVFAKAQTYALDNGATWATPSIDADGNVLVKAGVNRNSFFGPVFGNYQDNAQAEAAAGCCSPSTGSGVLPVAWTCRKPVIGSAGNSDDCEERLLGYTTAYVPMKNRDLTNFVAPTPPLTYWDKNNNYAGTVSDPTTLPANFFQNYWLDEYIYIIMDSAKTYDDTTYACSPLGTMDCDINKDGRNDILGGGDRGWLSLDGGIGTSDMVSLIHDVAHNLRQSNVSIHTWLPFVEGDKAPIFTEISEELLGKIVDVPVFNTICPSGTNPLTNSACQNNAHNPPNGFPGGPELYPYPMPKPQAHVISFAHFLVTCVDPPDPHGPKTPCPARKAGEVKDPITKKAPFSPSDKTIEGYFIDMPDENPNNTGCGGADTGTYIMTLTK